jgi:signal transduction histidine kinase
MHGAVMSFSDRSEHLRTIEEIRGLKAEIAEAEQRRTEFIAVLAHELRNPLAPLRTALQMMRKATDNATSMAQLRDMMERQLTQMVHLVNDLLDIARGKSGHVCAALASKQAYTSILRSRNRKPQATSRTLRMRSSKSGR